MKLKDILRELDRPTPDKAYKFTNKRYGKSSSDSATYKYEYTNRDGIEMEVAVDVDRVGKAKKEYDVDFGLRGNKNTRYDNTGTGDVLQQLATVYAAIKETTSKEGGFKKNDALMITAFGSRARVYYRYVKSLFPEAEVTRALGSRIIVRKIGNSL